MTSARTAHETAPSDDGSGVGRARVVTVVATVLSPLLFGLIIDWTGSGVFWVTSAICLAASVALFMVRIETGPDRPLT